MRVIEILNKISNGEEVPYKIKYNERIYEYAEEIKWYLRDDMKCELSNSKKLLNDEIEILEEPKEIPEKLKIEQDTPSSNYYIKNEYGTKCALTKHSKIIADKVNELLDYLESKGDE